MNPCNIGNIDISLIAKLENEIERNLQIIHGQHLYRGKAETFEEWLRQRFNLEACKSNGGGQ